jgi:hydrogenase maturation protein HypF
MNVQRARVVAHGAVQGVGFRPFVYRLAAELALRGWVLNSAQGVAIEVEGPRPALDEFILRLGREKPPRAFIQSMETSILDAAGYNDFEIRYSDDHGAKTTLILPDIATCPECQQEIFDGNNRRHLYPFTNCTNCGPRFSIIESLPYDRANTSMKVFSMCPDCEREYHDPRNRRFHAQPNACPNCGPHLELWSDAGSVLAKHHEALLLAANALREGGIIALKGIGGFQLLVDAQDDAAVRRLRQRKHREEKPFALMLPSLAAADGHCHISDLEARLLESPEAPIVLLERKPSVESIAPSVAPENPWLGVMLPYSPLHHLLMRDLDFPIVATSGNLGGEPICIDECEAISRLKGIADFFLVNNRPIARHLDDSIARVILGGTQILRRARGYAPLPISMANKDGNAILGVGAHLKNTIALAVEDQVFLSQHIGDLETERSCLAFQKVAADFQNLYARMPDIVACDSHPEYLSTKFAETWTQPSPDGLSVKLAHVQHHYAHVLSCAAENEIEPPFLGLAWDGTGLGTDGNIWGGEFLRVDATSFSRIGHLRQFRLPGGEVAIKQPCRTALGLLWEISEVFEHRYPSIMRNFSDLELQMLRKMLSQKINSPLTTSVGRLFDGVAAIMGLRQRTSFEGQAAMAVEFAAHGAGTDDRYQIALNTESTDETILDWEPMILEIIKDIEVCQPTATIAAKFHNALAEAAVEVARLANLDRIVLSGGCFQNNYLTERTVSRLRDEGFRPYWHQRVPPNDGGIALGQVVAALRQGREGLARPEQTHPLLELAS